MKIDPVELQQDPKNFGYLIVQACSDITKSVQECADTPGNFLVVMASEKYQFSPFIKELLVYLHSQVNLYYFYICILFIVIFFGVGLFTRNMIRKDITGPIIELKKNLEQKQNPSE
jgi:hypothetical protein